MITIAISNGNTIIIPEEREVDIQWEIREKDGIYINCINIGYKGGYVIVPWRDVVFFKYNDKNWEKKK